VIKAAIDKGVKVVLGLGYCRRAVAAPMRPFELGLVWVVYCKAPFAGPAQVLRYLSRYTHRVAISNRRLVAAGSEAMRRGPRGALSYPLLPHRYPTRSPRVDHPKLYARKRRMPALGRRLR
jgi:hypothetical protein